MSKTELTQINQGALLAGELVAYLIPEAKSEEDAMKIAKAVYYTIMGPERDDSLLTAIQAAVTKVRTRAGGRPAISDCYIPTLSLSLSLSLPPLLPPASCRKSRESPKRRTRRTSTKFGGEYFLKLRKLLLSPATLLMMESPKTTKTARPTHRKRLLRFPHPRSRRS